MMDAPTQLVVHVQDPLSNQSQEIAVHRSVALSELRRLLFRAFCGVKLSGCESLLLFHSGRELCDEFPLLLFSDGGGRVDLTVAWSGVVVIDGDVEAENNVTIKNKVLIDPKRHERIQGARPVWFSGHLFLLPEWRREHDELLPPRAAASFSGKTPPKFRLKGRDVSVPFTWDHVHGVIGESRAVTVAAHHLVGCTQAIVRMLSLELPNDWCALYVDCRKALLDQPVFARISHNRQFWFDKFISAAEAAAAGGAMNVIVFLDHYSGCRLQGDPSFDDLRNSSFCFLRVVDFDDEESTQSGVHIEMCVLEEEFVARHIPETCPAVVRSMLLHPFLFELVVRYRITATAENWRSFAQILDELPPNVRSYFPSYVQMNWLFESNVHITLQDALNLLFMPFWSRWRSKSAACESVFLPHFSRLYGSISGPERNSIMQAWVFGGISRPPCSCAREGDTLAVWKFHAGMWPCSSLRIITKGDLVNLAHSAALCSAMQFWREMLEQGHRAQWTGEHRVMAVAPTTLASNTRIEFDSLGLERERRFYAVAKSCLDAMRKTVFTYQPHFEAVRDFNFVLLLALLGCVFGMAWVAGTLVKIAFGHRHDAALAFGTAIVIISFTTLACIEWPYMKRYVSLQRLNRKVGL